MPGTGLSSWHSPPRSRVGASVVEELTLECPLALAEGASVQLQLTVAEPDEQGRRAIGIYSRPDGTPEDELEVDEWARHASGVLGGGEDEHA